MIDSFRFHELEKSHEEEKREKKKYTVRKIGKGERDENLVKNNEKLNQIPWKSMRVIPAKVYRS